MSKIYYKAMIEDMTSDQCTDREIECLLDHYQAVVKQVGLARTAFYDLADFPLALKYKVDKFKLKIDPLQRWRKLNPNQRLSLSQSGRSF